MTKGFNFTVSENVNGRWISVPRTGTGRVLSQGFQMQTGTDGYVLEVIDGNHYPAGTIITISKLSARAA